MQPLLFAEEVTMVTTLSIIPSITLDVVVAVSPLSELASKFAVSIITTPKASTRRLAIEMRAMSVRLSCGTEVR
jgi:hypothetical protein